MQMMEGDKQKHLLIQLNKTRGKGKIGKVLGLKDSYKEFNKTQSKDNPFYVDYTTYKAICAEFNKEVIKDILLDSGTFKVPYRLGEIRIQKRKMDFSKPAALKVDWKKTNASGIRVYHMNDHRDNYRYKWHWKKSSAIVKNKTAYSFIASRANSRELAKILLTNRSIDYFE